MELIGNLSRETVQMFKDQRKHNIQRTFVTGSDAASARVTKGMHLLKFLLSKFTAKPYTLKMSVDIIFFIISQVQRENIQKIDYMIKTIKSYIP